MVTATALEENTEAPVLAVEMGGIQVITTMTRALWRPVRLVMAD